MKKGFTIIPVLLGIAIVVLLGLGFGAYKGQNLAGTPTNVSSSTSINSLYGTVNDLVDYVRSTTSTLGIISTLSSTTGNLIIGSSSSWIAKTVGTNGLFLTASSTAQGGIGWENLTGYTGTIGASAGRITKLWATDLDSTNGTIGTLIISSVVSGDLTVNGGNVNLASTTKTYQVGGTAVISSSTVFGVASTSIQQKSFSINLVGPTSTDIAFGQHIFAGTITLTQVSCSDDISLVTSTIYIDRRTSSTPNTLGPSMVGALACGLGRGTTSTFNIATSTRDFVINFGVTSTAGYSSTSTLHIQGFYTIQ